jgi:hypothetical protein
VKPLAGLLVLGTAVGAVFAYSEVKKRAQQAPVLEPGKRYRWTVRIRSDAPGAQNACEAIRLATQSAADAAAGKPNPIEECEVRPLEVRFVTRFQGKAPYPVDRAVASIESTGFVEVLSVEPRDAGVS